MGRQVPFDSDRVAYPPTRSLLQDETRSSAHLEVRILHRFRPRRLKRRKELCRIIKKKKNDQFERAFERYVLVRQRHVLLWLPFLLTFLKCFLTFRYCQEINEDWKLK